MSETLEVLWYLFVTHLAALRWTISSECFCLEMCGSQTVAAYSSLPWPTHHRHSFTHIYLVLLSCTFSDISPTVAVPLILSFPFCPTLRLHTSISTFSFWPHPTCAFFHCPCPLLQYCIFPPYLRKIVMHKHYHL